MHSTHTEQRIYVACLAAYNNGILHGRWINCTADKDEMLNEIQDILKTSPIEDAEEWAIHDYEGFGNWRLDEYESLDEIANFVEALENCKYPLDLVSEIMSYFDYDITQAIDYIQDNYAGEYDSLGEWAECFLDETGQLSDIPEHLRYYFDWEAYGRCRETNGDILYISNYVLWSS